MKCFTTLLLLLFATFSFAQNVTTLTDSVGLHAYIIKKGDVAAISFDTAYVLNKRIYQLYKTNYNKVLKGNNSTNTIITAYDELVALQDSMLKTKEFYYQQLKGSFDSLAGNTNLFMDKTDSHLTGISSSLNSASANIENIKLRLDDSLDKLKSQNKLKIKLAVGGFTIGVVVTAIIFLVAK
jgi:hypothetical protein